MTYWRLVAVAVVASALAAEVQAAAAKKPGAYSLTCQQVTAAAADLRRAINTDFEKDEDGKSYRRLIGGFVRLAFHMCTGGKCKGCINANDPSNIHLDQYVSVLEQLYTRNSAFSRGDFWTLAAMVALVESEKLTNVRLGRNFKFMYDGLTFRFGRVDCSPSSPFTSVLNEFPDAGRGVDHVLDFFARNFNMNADETVILLGAHNLGGFRNPKTHAIVRQWVSPADTLTNDYYTFMMNDSHAFTQTGIRPCTGCAPVVMFENANHKRMMLNADIALRKNLTFANGVDGFATCTMATCANSATLPFVQEYADSDEHWEKDFAEVMNKMVETGYAANALQALKGCVYF